MKTSVKRILLLLLGALLIAASVGCYPTRLAKNPNGGIDASVTDKPEDTFDPDISDEPTEAPTEAPTSAPTEEATPAPTEEATQAPTEGPEDSAVPTGTPEPSGTPVPTNTAAADTPAPTPAPTPTPTPAPTPEPTAAPTEAPSADFVFKTYDFYHGNREYTESVFFNQKLTMINIWSTTCGPCMEELPFFGDLASRYSGRVKILTVLYDSSTDGAIDTATAFLDSIGFTLPALRYNNSMKSAFGGYLNPPTLPTTIFVDQQGHFVYCKKGAQTYSQWCALLDSLL